MIDIDPVMAMIRDRLPLVKKKIITDDELEIEAALWLLRLTTYKKLPDYIRCNIRVTQGSAPVVASGT